MIEEEKAKEEKQITERLNREVNSHIEEWYEGRASAQALAMEYALEIVTIPGIDVRKIREKIAEEAKKARAYSDAFKAAKEGKNE